MYFIKSKNKWRAGIQANKNKIHLGYFESIEKTKECRLNAEIKYFGEFSNRKDVKYEDSEGKL